MTSLGGGQERGGQRSRAKSDAVAWGQFSVPPSAGVTHESLGRPWGEGVWLQGGVTRGLSLGTAPTTQVPAGGHATTSPQGGLLSWS